jgi:hypothetical protein
MPGEDLESQSEDKLTRRHMRGDFEFKVIRNVNTASRARNRRIENNKQTRKVRRPRLKIKMYVYLYLTVYWDK